MMTLMDVLKPEIINLEGRRYRKTPMSTKVNVEEESPKETYIEEDYYTYDDEVDSCEMEYETIEKIEGGGYMDRIKDIPNFYFGIIVGAENGKRKILEKQTKTMIQVPRIGFDGDIVISGKDRSGVLTAKTKIKTIIDMHRGDQPPGHFLSIPLESSELIENFAQFKKNVLAMKTKGMEASLFQRPERLHLTLCLLTFLNDAELRDSLQDLTDTTMYLKEKHFRKETNVVKIRVQGIEYMNDDPGEVDVLYAKIQLLDGSNNFLQKFVDKLVSTLVDSGYLKKQYDRVNLHATVINTLFRDDKNREFSNSKSYNKKPRVTFDAKAILETYSDFFFGDIEVNALHVAVRKQFDADGRYIVAAEIPLS